MTFGSKIDNKTQFLTSVQSVSPLNNGLNLVVKQPNGRQKINSLRRKNQSIKTNIKIFELVVYRSNLNSKFFRKLFSLRIFKSSHQRCSVRKGVLRNFA